MNPRLGLLICLAAIVHSAGAQHEPYLMATFDMESVRGEVIFTEPGEGNGVTMMFRLNSTDGSKDKYTWEFRRYLTDYREEDKCDDRYIGKKFSSETGTVTMGAYEHVTARTIHLWGLNGIVGYTLLLNPTQSSKKPACATIMFRGRHVTAYARLQNSIGGRIIFRQYEQTEYTTIYSDLYYMAPGTQQRSSYHWYIFHPTTETDASEMCRSLKTRYKPRSRVEKLPMLPVGQNPYDQREAWVEQNVWVTGTDNIIGKWVGIVDENEEVIACSFIQEYRHKTAHVYFEGDGSWGSIRFEQDSPYDPTVLYVNFENLRDQASGYHVHKYPVSQRITANEVECSNSELSGHWNPFDIPLNSSPAPGTGTNDQYEVGDLSGKFGTLNGRDTFAETYWDWNLPLFEEYSIIGRSFVVHRTDGSRWFCSNVNYPEDTVILMAKFWYPVFGFAMFRQSTKDPMSDTTIYFELDYSDGTGPTMDHEWKIGERTATDWNDKDGAHRCSSTGNVYNPFNLALDGQYMDSCRKERGFHCAVGDITKRVGGIQIRSGFKKRPAKKTFITTTFLPLFGPYSIEGRSLVIFDNIRQNRLACATIYRHWPYKAVMRQMYHTTTSMQGSVTFEQQTQFDPAVVRLDMLGLNKKVNTWAIYFNPAVENSHSSCSKVALGYMWNPFRVPIQNLPSPGQGTHSQYPMGDMSGKFGYFGDRGHEKKTMRDYNLALYGPSSVMERAMAVSNDYSEIKGCGNMSFLQPEAERWEARVNFWGYVHGYVHMWQYVYPDGHTTETWVYIDVNNNEGRMSRNHDWRIHRDPVWEEQFADRTPDSNNGNVSDEGEHKEHIEEERRVSMEEGVQRACSRVGEVYNPFDVNTNNGYAECEIHNQPRCAVGDMSSKHGTYNVGDNGYLYVDRNLPLFGEWSIYGRAMVFYSENHGQQKMSCADVVPINQPYVILSYWRTKKFDKVDLMNKVAKALQTEAWHFAIEQMPIHGECRVLKFYFLGDDEYNPVKWKTKFEQYLSERDEKKGNFYPDNCDSAGFLTSSIVLTACLLLFQRLFY